MRFKNIFNKFYILFVVGGWITLLAYISQTFAAPPNLVNVARFDNLVIQLETNSITHVGSTRRFKLHTNFITPQQNNFVDNEQNVHTFTEPVVKMVDTIEMNCIFETFSVVKKQFFSKTLRSLDVYQPENPKLEYVVPENVAGLLFPVLCNKKPSVKYEV